MDLRTLVVFETSMQLRDWIVPTEQLDQAERESLSDALLVAVARDHGLELPEWCLLNAREQVL